jgi:hypothetical protein
VRSAISESLASEVLSSHAAFCTRHLVKYFSSDSPTRALNLAEKLERDVPTLAASEGHRFRFTAEGSHTRVDHELEMTPKGIFKLFSPLMGMIGRKHLRRTADALQKYLEGSKPLEK